MMNAGFVYVLANSAMAGLVKVGKTTRSPNERAAELSKATGLPSPFIVVYEQFFNDCHETEAFVHTYLERKGYRVSSTREFFNAPVNEVVRAVSMAPGAIDNDNCVATTHAWNGTKPDEDDLDLLTLKGSSSDGSPPWDDIFIDAESHYWGVGDCLQDRAEAYRLFKQAASLGCLAAYPHLGRMTKDGEGVRADEQKALDLFKEGARKGSIYCYMEMAKLFEETNQTENAHKCYSMFANKFSYDLVDEVQITEDEVRAIYSDCADLVHHKWHRRNPIPIPMQRFIVENAMYVRKSAESTAGYAKRNGNTSFEAIWRETVDFIDAFAKNPRLLAD
ncbi:GIY-YIG nuclease family protein [Caballeronia sp. RCC_10]|uniref:GIY-YIG nuclease family protein n=1 Tax=Caballeronia sp. RCC_10 TaxID=3239227 RepID=UPI0035246735